MNYPKKLKNAIETGAEVLPGVFDVETIQYIQAQPEDYSVLAHSAPQLGCLVTQLAMCLPDQSRVSVKYDTVPPAQKQDLLMDPPRHGMSLLVPLSGPNARLYYSDVQLHYPSETDVADSFEYGVGDAAIVRQQVSVVSGGEVTRYPQIWHMDAAEYCRNMLVCDFTFDDPVDGSKIN